MTEFKTPIKIKIPPSPFLNRLGHGAGVSMMQLERSPHAVQIRWTLAHKLLKPRVEGNSEFDRIKKEADLLRRMSHPNIVGFRAFSRGKILYSGVEACDLSLGDMIEKTIQDGGEPFTPTQILKEPMCTVFQAELLAIARATDLVVLRGFDCAAVISDTRSSLDLIRYPETHHPLATHIRKNIREQEGNGKILRFFWVKAHVGIPGNERADELARQAAAQSRVAPAYDRCPVSYVKRRLREGTVAVWNGRYTGGVTAGVTRMFFPDVVRARKVLKCLDRTSIWAQILTGHGGFAAYLHKFKLKSIPACVYDTQASETIQHLLFECPRHNRDRYDLEVSSGRTLTEITICDLMADKHSRPYLERFCLKIAKICIDRNRTRTR